MSKELRQANWQLLLFGLFKIPLIGFCRPRIIELTEDKIVIRIPLRRRTKNHLNSLYFGAFAIGADLAGGFHAFWLGKKEKRNISLAFKSLQADFLKRAEDDVYFVSESGKSIREMFDKSIESGERITQNIPISAYTGYPNNPEQVADFLIGLSIKDKGRV